MIYKGSCHCGKVSFEVEADLDPSGKLTAAVNVRCLEGIELSTLKRMPFDGRS
jgi:hypothetical protein